MRSPSSSPANGVTFWVSDRSSAEARRRISRIKPNTSVSRSSTAAFSRLLLILAAFQQPFLVIARDGRLEGRHDAEPEIDQIVLAAEKLVRDEGGGMDVAVVASAVADLENCGFQHAARVVADTGDAEIEDREDAFELAMRAPPASRNPRSLP